MPGGIMIVRSIPPAYFDEFMGIPPEGVRLKKVRQNFEVSGAMDPFKLGTGLAPSQAGTIADIRGRTWGFYITWQLHQAMPRDGKPEQRQMQLMWL